MLVGVGGRDARTDVSIPLVRHRADAFVLGSTTVAHGVCVTHPEKGRAPPNHHRPPLATKRPRRHQTTPSPPNQMKVFASHDWGHDGANHARVAVVVEKLCDRGIEVWFDASHMSGNLLDSMCRGMDESDLVLLFVTQNYMRKVESRDEADNVRREFMYAANTPKKLLAIRFDKDLPRAWTGPLGMLLGQSLYVDMSATEDVEELCRVITRKVTRAAAPTYRAAPTLPPRPPTPPCGERGPSIKERVARVKKAYGGPEVPGERSKDVLDRLLHSMAPEPAASDLPFADKLAMVERHMGFA